MATRTTLWVIDRFEGSWAVVERDDGSTFNLPRALLPAASAEGDVLRVDGEQQDDAAHWHLERDLRETERRRERAQRALDELRRRDPGGDIKL